MRGEETQQGAAFSYVSAEERIPADHPLRAIRGMTDEVLDQMGPAFEDLYSWTGRPSIPPERLLRALLLQALYTIRSERLLMEQLNYNLLFCWFVGMDLDEKAWSPTVPTKNRDRLLEGEGAAKLFTAVVGCLKAADGFAERAAAIGLIEPLAKRQRITQSADKGYDTAAFVAALRERGVTQHVSQNCNGRRSAIDGRTTRHVGYRLSQMLRPMIERVPAWLKNVAGQRKTKLRGRARVGWSFLVRMRNLELAT